MFDHTNSAEVGALIDELVAQTEAAKAAGEIELLSALIDRARDFEQAGAEANGR